MPNSILEAIEQGIWNFEPEEMDKQQYESTRALPGSDEKLAVLALRLKQGKPLWHPQDRCTYED